MISDDQGHICQHGLRRLRTQYRGRIVGYAQPFGVVVRERTQQYCFNYAEYRGIGAREAVLS
jgi:hypothetical protein